MFIIIMVSSFCNFFCNEYFLVIKRYRYSTDVRDSTTLLIARYDSNISNEVKNTELLYPMDKTMKLQTINGKN